MYIYVHAYLYIDETNLHCYTEFKHEFKDEFTSICCRRGTSGLGLCALENAISSGKQGDRQVWASTYMLLVDRTWKEEKARKRWSNACARYTLQDLFLAWCTKRFGLHAILYRTPCLAWWLTNPMLAMFGMEAFQRDFEGIPFLRFCWRHGAFGMEECNLPYVPMESFARLHRTFGIAFRGNVFRWRWVRGKRDTAAVSVFLEKGNFINFKFDTSS